MAAWRGGGWMLGIAWVLLDERSADAQPRRCLDAIALEGDAGAVERVRNALGEGPLATTGPSPCDRASVRIEGRDGRWHVGLTRDGRTVEHETDDPVLIATWVESWLVPNPAPEPSPAAAPAVDGEVPPRRRGRGDALTPQTRSPAPLDRGVPLQVALRGSVDLDEIAPVWPGGELAISVLVGPRAWLGLGAAAAFTPERDRTLRRALRLSGRGGWSNPLGWGELRLAAGIGIVSASAQRELDDNKVVRDAEAGPFLEVLTSVDVALTESLAISLAILGRAHLPDFDDFTEGGDDGDEPGDVEGEPEPLPGFAATFQVGLAWDLARPR